MAYHGKDHLPKLGTGERFAALKSKIATKGKGSNPAAVAAAIGRKKYGKERFQKLSAKGRKRANPVVRALQAAGR